MKQSSPPRPKNMKLTLIFVISFLVVNLLIALVLIIFVGVPVWKAVSVSLFCSGLSFISVCSSLMAANKKSQNSHLKQK